MLRRALAASALTLATMAGLTVAITPAASADPPVPPCGPGFACVLVFFADPGHVFDIGDITRSCDGFFEQNGRTSRFWDGWSAPC
jgi:hypothetical protein